MSTLKRQFRMSSRREHLINIAIFSSDDPWARDECRQLLVDTPVKHQIAATRAKDQRSFARAREVARAIVAERHDRPSLVSNIACEVAAEIIEGQRSPGDDLNSVEL